MRVSVGNYLRDLRLNNGQTLKQMAEILGVSSSFLSAVENGKKSMPNRWNKILSNEYHLNNAQLDDLKQAIKDSAASVKLNLADSNDSSRKLAISFARNFNDLSEAEKSKIMKILG